MPVTVQPSCESRHMSSPVPWAELEAPVRSRRRAELVDSPNKRTAPEETDAVEKATALRADIQDARAGPGPMFEHQPSYE